MIRKTFALFLLCFLTILPLSAQIEGTWSGELNVSGYKLPLNFNFVITKNSNVMGTIDSPQQNAYGIPCTSVEVSDNSIVVKITSLNASYEGTVQGDSIVGTFTQGMQFPLTLRKQTTVAKPKDKPQTPQPPFSYRVKDVKFNNNADGVTLAGTLTMPAEGKNFPAVVLVSGSGAQNRDEEIFGHRPFAVIADYLTKNGFAVLRYDDRGTAESTGSFKDATTANFASDAESAFKFLASQPEIDSHRIGYIGHSEGGLIAMMNASNDKSVAFIVTLAGPAVKGRDLMIRQNELILEANGMTSIPPSEHEKIVKIFDEIANSDNTESLKSNLTTIMTGGLDISTMPESVQENINAQVSAMTTPWYINFIKTDPADYLKRMKCPIFALGGSFDVQVEASSNLAAIKSLCVSKSVTTKEYPNLNHLFQHCTSKQEGLKYGEIDETFSTEVLADIVNWLKSVIK